MCTCSFEIALGCEISTVAGMCLPSKRLKSIRKNDWFSRQDTLIMLIKFKFVLQKIDIGVVAYKNSKLAHLKSMASIHAHFSDAEFYEVKSSSSIQSTFSNSNWNSFLRKDQVCKTTKWKLILIQYSVWSKVSIIQFFFLICVLYQSRTFWKNFWILFLGKVRKVLRGFQSFQNVFV